MEQIPQWLAKFQSIDRRIIYLCVSIAIALPFIVTIRLPVIPTLPTQKFYEAVEKVPKGKVVIVAADFDTGTEGENGPQVQAVLEHLMRRRIPFVIIGVAIQGPQLVQSYADSLAKKYGYQYGRDYVNLGYIAGGQPALERFCRSIWQMIPKDAKGTALTEIPMMRKVRSANDIALVAEFTGAGVLDYYIQTFWGQFKVPLAQGCTGIIGPEQFPYLATGQLSGLMVGLKGAAEYEALLNLQKEGYRRMMPQSMGHIIALLLILLGNLGMWLTYRRRQLRRL
ncbi:MAG: hypothetical protein NZ805_14225 [Armatimonadetes bacterium]|nr:hypothetical protein [Armatimonadota bacterium]MDW8029954.1 hypothetical protein [Armatimonadota bacterium]